MSESFEGTVTAIYDKKVGKKGSIVYTLYVKGVEGRINAGFNKPNCSKGDTVAVTVDWDEQYDCWTLVSLTNVEGSSDQEEQTSSAPASKAPAGKAPSSKPDVGIKDIKYAYRFCVSHAREMIAMAYTEEQLEKLLGKDVKKRLAKLQALVEETAMDTLRKVEDNDFVRDILAGDKKVPATTAEMDADDDAFEGDD